MDKKRRLFLITVFILFCAGLGFHGGVGVAKQNPFSDTPSMPLLPSPEAEQDLTPTEIKVLFIVTDSVTVQLRSAWYVVYHPSQNRLFWFPLFPQSGVLSGETNAHLAQSFQVLSEQRVSEAFITYLQDVYQTRWDKVILLDQKNLADIVDLLNGIELNGELMNGMQWMNTNAQETPSEHASFIAAICKKRNDSATYPHILAGIEQYMLQHWSEENGAQTTAQRAFKLLIQLIKQEIPLPCEFIGL